MSDDLVQRVARAACASVNSADTWGETGTDVHEMVWFPIARAAIAVCMEEAAKVADRVADEAAVHCREALLDDARAIAEQCADECAGARKAAAAIRALVKQSTTEEERA